MPMISRTGADFAGGWRQGLIPACAAIALCVWMAAAANPAHAATERDARPTATRSSPSRAREHVTRATVLDVQHLFVQLGYPLGSKPLGGLGQRTRGALSYFQRKYGLPVTGYPDARTISRMRAVAASLRGSSGHAASPPHDLVERVLGNGVPILAIAIALAVALGALALSAGDRASHDSAPAGSAEDTIALASGES